MSNKTLTSSEVPGRGRATEICPGATSLEMITSPNVALVSRKSFILPFRMALAPG